MLPYTILSFFPAPVVSVQSTANRAPVLEQNGYSLTCDVSGAHNLNPSITYQWTKNNGSQTQIQVGADNVLSFSPLRLSDAGRYTCQATVRSSYLNNNITVMSSQDVTLQSEFSLLIIYDNIIIVIVKKQDPKPGPDDSTFDILLSLYKELRNLYLN